MIARLVRQAQPPANACLLGASAVAFLLIAASGPGGGMLPFCGRGLPPAALLAAGRLEWLTFDPGRWTLEWAAMVCAMMLPLLIQPVDHIVRTTLKSRLARSVTLFVLAYCLAWLPAAMLISPVAGLLRLALTPVSLAILPAAIALLWSASPWAQMARNRSHRFFPLRIRGAAADSDCIRFGLNTGIYCALACWPWMLLSQAIPGHGAGTMLAITLILAAERAMPPGPPRWQMPRILAFLAWQRPYRALGRL